MHTSTHIEVARRAETLWRKHGHPAGRDTEFWLEAEQQLAQAAESDSAAEAPTIQPVGEVFTNDTASIAMRLRAVLAPERGDAFSVPTGVDEAEPAKGGKQKAKARAPILPNKTAPKAAPSETGKPLWNRHHSS